MLTRSYSAAIEGVEGYIITVEADVDLGLPGLTLVGRISGALNEARQRVRAALGHSGHQLPPRKQLVNLAPADRRKDSSGNDLAIACALLASHEVIPVEALGKTLLWGELALDGKLRAARGTLVVADAARRFGFERVVVPCEVAKEAALIPGIEVIGVGDLASLVAFLRGETEIAGTPAPRWLPDGEDEGPDMAEVRGLTLARLAVETMAAGGHNLLLYGPPGVGKTMLARRAAGLLPALTPHAAVEVTKIHTLHRARALTLLRRPPVRMPHHTVSPAGLLGGGNPPRPGEVSLAHRGLLFLDELPEFPRACIEGLREPLEDGSVSVVRAGYAIELPARFQLMAASAIPRGVALIPPRRSSATSRRSPDPSWTAWTWWWRCKRRRPRSWRMVRRRSRRR
jgi:magnesium chelatase family protein